MVIFALIIVDTCRRKWQSAPVLLSGESHGQRSLMGYSPWDCKVGHDLPATLGLLLYPGECSVCTCVYFAAFGWVLLYMGATQVPISR